jgi:hypothetical protein
MADTAFTVKLASTGQEIAVASRSNSAGCSAWRGAGCSDFMRTRDLWHMFDAGRGRDS